MKLRLLLCASTAAGLVGTTPVAAQTTPTSPPAGADATQPVPTDADTAAVGASPTGAVQEVIVTAEHRVASIQKTAMNISAVSGAALVDQGVHNIGDLSTDVPGLYMSPQTNYIGLYGTASGSGTPWADTVMSFNYGGVPLNRPVDTGATMYDLDRVEVLKGPQGTLYGRNSTVGAVNLVLAQPTDQYSSDVSASLGNYDAVQAQGDVNLPLSDTLAARVAFEVNRHDGYLSSGYDDANDYGVRGSLLWKPNDKFSLLLWTDTYVNRSKGPESVLEYYFAGQRWINPSNPWQDLSPAGTCRNQVLCPSYALTSVGGVNEQPNQAQGPSGNGFTDLTPTGLAHLSQVVPDGAYDQDQNIYTAEMNWHTGVGLATVIGSFVHSYSYTQSSGDGLFLQNLTKANQETMEARLASEGSSPLQWVTGVFLFNENTFAWQEGIQPGGGNTEYSPNLNDQSYAAFGDITYSVTRRFRLLGGLRYTYEEKTQDGYNITPGLAATGAVSVATLEKDGLTCYLGSNTPATYANVQNKINLPFIGYFNYPSNICVIPNGGDLIVKKLNWKAGAEFDVNPTSMLYFTAKTGFRSGGFGPGTQNTYLPEEVTDFELGSKNRFFDGRLQANASAFYWEYDNQQLSELQQFYVNGLPVGQFSYPTNINGNLYGTELALEAMPTLEDHLSFDVLWARGKLDKTPFLVNSAGVLAPETNVDRPNLPEWTLTFGYDHLFDLGDAGTLDPGLQVHYASTTILTLYTPGDLVPGDIQPAYALLNLYATYKPRGAHWQLEGFIDNVANTPVAYSGANAPIFFRPTVSSYTTVAGATSADVRVVPLMAPRTFGIRLKAHF